MDPGFYDGDAGLRVTTPETAPSDAFVFDGAGPNPDSSGYFEGFIRRVNPEQSYYDGQLPGIVTTPATAGEIKLGDVIIPLSSAEKSLVSKWPEFFATAANNLKRFQWIVWPLVFASFFFFFKRAIK